MLAFGIEGNLDVNLPENECSLPHFRCECRDVGFDAIVHRDSSKQLMDHWEMSIVCRNKAANLSHHTEKRHRSDVSAFATHVAPGYNLKPGLLTGIDIVRNKFVLMDLVVNNVNFTPAVYGGKKNNQLLPVPALDDGLTRWQPRQ